MNPEAKPVENCCFRDYKNEQKEDIEEKFRRNRHRENV